MTGILKTTWRFTRISEVCKVESGRRPSGKEVYDTGYFSLGGEHITNDHQVNYNKNNWFITEKFWYSLRKGKLDVGATLLVKDGATIGKCAYFNPFKVKYISSVNEHVYKIVSKSYICDNRFLYYSICSPGCQAQIRNCITGSAQPGLNRSFLKVVKVPFPDLATQHKIASILSAYDDLIENNNRRIKILEKMAQTIYNEWFITFRFPGYKKVKMVDLELRKIPEEWAVKKVEEIVERIHPGKLYNSNTVRKSGKIPVLDQGRSGIIGYHNDEPGVKASENNPIIVFANHTCYQNLILFPFSAIQNVLPFIPSKANSRNIFWLHWATKDLVRFNDYKGHWPEFMNKKLIVPPRYICDEFGEAVKPMRLQIYKLRQQDDTLCRTRDLLLPKLINGEIDMDEIDIKLHKEDKNG